MCDSGGWGDRPVSPACRGPAVWLSGRFFRIPPEPPSLGFLLLFKGFCGLSEHFLSGRFQILSLRGKVVFTLTFALFVVQPPAPSGSPRRWGWGWILRASVSPLRSGAPSLPSARVSPRGAHRQPGQRILKAPFRTPPPRRLVSSPAGVERARWAVTPVRSGCTSLPPGDETPPCRWGLAGGEGETW